MTSIFGPVPSRRLGRSLGIDVIPPKTCSYDCIYCESGPTTHLTVNRQAFVDPDQVIQDLLAYFREYPDSVDVLTFSSAGEPTLYEPMGYLVRGIKRHFPFLPLILLTNGSLFWDSNVRKAVLDVDRVVPSLDAVSKQVFRSINRPHASLDLTLVVEGLKALRKDYRGRFHLEVMLVAGVNDHPDELKKIRSIIDLVCPDRVELNTIVRPPADPGAGGLAAAEMEAAWAFFPADRTEIIGRFTGFPETRNDVNLERRVLDMVRRRPCTVGEMADSLGVPPADLQQVLSDLFERKEICRRIFNDQEYVCVAAGHSGSITRYLLKAEEAD